MNRTACLELLDVATLLGISLPEVILGIVVHRHTFTWLEVGADSVGFHLLVRQRDHTDESLRLRTVVSVVILTRMHLQTDVFLEIRHLGRIEGELIPTRNRRVESIVEKRVAVAIVRPGP